MTKLETIANRSRLDLIRSSCGENTTNVLDDALEKASLQLDKPYTQIIELFNIIDNVNDIDTDKLPIYSAGNRKVHVIDNEKDANKAVNVIRNHRIIGFDTEQKPTFTKNTPTNGISLIQIATKLECFIFQVKLFKNIRPILSLLEDTTIVKVGSGLKGDKSTLAKEFRITLKKTIDLGSLFKSKLGHEHEIGIKKAVTSILDQKITKSKKMSTSNWEKTNLTDNQIKYAAEDSFAAYDVFCSLLIKYPFTLNAMPNWFQDMFRKGFFSDDLL